MADQEFLASFAVEIDETGVTRLQTVLEENRKLAEELAGTFDAASAAVRALSEELGVLPDFSGRGPADFPWAWIFRRLLETWIVSPDW